MSADKRDAIARTAEQLRQADNKNGGSMSHDQARDRVARTVERAERQADNRNR